MELGLRAPPLWMPALNYHRVHPSPASQPFDRGVIDATPAELDEQMEVLARHFTPIGVSELADHVTHGRPLPERPALVTFDDAYRECLTLALPILRARGVRASFFVPTALVGDRRVPWWDRVSYIVRSSPLARIELRYPVRTELDLSSEEDAVRELLGIFKRRYAIDTERFFDELGEAAGVHWDAELERRFADELLLDWDGLRELTRAGMEVHSHTRTHRLLQNLDPKSARDEIAESRRDIRRELGVDARALSYPVGRPITSRPWLVSAMAEAGYELGFSTGTQGSTHGVDRFDVGRVSIDFGTELSQFRALLVHPKLLAA